MSISLHKILFGAAPLSLGLLGLALPAELLAADETPVSYTHLTLPTKA